MSQSHMSQSHIYCLPILIEVTALPELQLPLPCLSIVPHNYASRLCLTICSWCAHNVLAVTATPRPPESCSAPLEFPLASPGVPLGLPRIS